MKTLTLPSRRAPRPLPFGLALAMLWLAASGVAQAALTFEEALARDPRTNEPLYREQHLVRRDGGTNLACFRPALVGNVRKGQAYRLTWAGSPHPAIESI